MSVVKLGIIRSPSQLDECAAAIQERDDAISVLTAKLKAVTENRDQIQSEYTLQADSMSSHVQLLQGQLRQVRSLLQSFVL